MAVNTIAYTPPTWKLIGTTPDGDFDSYPVNTGQTIYASDVVILSSGAVSKGASNPATILGIATHGNQQVYVDETGNAGAPGFQTMFGYNQVATALFPNEPSNIHVLVPNAGLTEIEFSWDQSLTYAQTLVGTTVGLELDGTSGFWYVSTTPSNKIATVVQLVQGPGQQILGNTGGGRVVVKFLAAGLQA